MACPTCTATMENLGMATVAVYWCPRCGTLKYGPGGSAESPSLVARCRGYVEEIDAMGPEAHAVLAHLHTLGIIEAINPPSARPSI